jgi:hypothetical protein
MRRVLCMTAVAVMLAAAVVVRGESTVAILDEGHYVPGMCYRVRAWSTSSVEIGSVLTVLEQYGNYYNEATESWDIPDEDMGITPAEALTYDHYTVAEYGSGAC